MNEFLSLLSTGTGGVEAQSAMAQTLIALMVASFLGVLISLTYKHTHRGVSYSQSFTHVVIVMTMVIAMIMILIGSNIARAFSLVGALSIIRYRTAVKDARDTMFVFFALMAGMAAGIGLYGVGVFATVFICFVIFLLTLSNFGSLTGNYHVLRVHVPMQLPYDEEITPLVKQVSTKTTFLSAESVRQGSAIEVSYKISLKSGESISTLINKIRKKTGNQKISYYSSDHATSEI